MLCSFFIFILSSYNTIVDLIRTPSLGKILFVDASVIPHNIKEALRPHQRNDIKLTINLQFKPATWSPDQNLFQTDYLNTGIRAELSDGTLAIIINNAEKAEDPLIVIFPTTVSPGMWYELSINAIEAGRISADLKSCYQRKRSQPQSSSKLIGQNSQLITL